MNFFINSAYAQAAEGAAQTPSGIYNLLFLGGFVVIFYFLIWRPQSKRAKEVRSLLDNLKVGDEVMSTGGLLGRLNRIDDHYVSLQVADNVELKLQKTSITAVLPKGTLKAI
ncbi:MAG: preprotein translocase subunit YajC [Pseudomonadales bacterium]|jgi:preprotein translocase subunit YajC|nr:preprotein translocase subunit YajC [Pseudomonadales bacterium]